MGCKINRRFITGNPDRHGKTRALPAVVHLSKLVRVRRRGCTAAAAGGARPLTAGHGS